MPATFRPAFPLAATNPEAIARARISIARHLRRARRDFAVAFDGFARPFAQIVHGAARLFQGISGFFVAQKSQKQMRRADSATITGAHFGVRVFHNAFGAFIQIVERISNRIGILTCADMAQMLAESRGVEVKWPQNFAQISSQAALRDKEIRADTPKL